MNLRKLITAALPKGTKYLGEPSTTTKAPLLKQDEISKYEFANGTLPVQGQLGNCWLIAPMLAIQLKDPQYFNARIQLQPDAEIAKVKLNVHGKEKWVKVSLKIPFNADGSPAYAYATKDNSTQSPSGQKVHMQPVYGLA